MKKLSNLCVVAFLSTSVLGQVQQTINVSSPTSPVIVSRDANSRIWEYTNYNFSLSGQAVPQLCQFTELADGLCYQQGGQWLDSQEQINLLPDGTAGATNGQYQAYFPPDIYDGVIKLAASDGIELQSQPIALTYDDGSNTVIIAVLTNSVGQLVSSNQVIYTNAFYGLDADLLYTYRKGGFEQDIVLEEQPPTPQSLGLNPQTSTLQVLTEFLDPPQPTVNSMSLQTDAGEMTDDNLDFGATKVVPGKAFLLGTNEPNVKVMKQWVQLDGRQFLVESVPMTSVTDDLNELPQPVTQVMLSSKFQKALTASLLPRHRFVKTIGTKAFASRTTLPSRALVLDYVTANGGLTNYVFQGDTTYYINGTVYLSGTNTFEGGAILKYAYNASLQLYPWAAPIIWPSTPYRPVIFTACNDHTVGSAVPGSSQLYCANPVLGLGANTLPLESLSNFRMLYCQNGIEQEGGDQVLTITNGQFEYCQGEAIYYFEAAGVLLENSLFAYCHIDIASFGNTIVAENSTFFNYVNNLWYPYNAGPGTYNQLFLTNCVLAEIGGLVYSTNMIVTTNYYVMGGNNNGFYETTEFGANRITNSFYPFATAGRGEFYLTNNCNFRGSGTNLMDPTLLADLATKTTYPPVVYAAKGIAVSTNFNPQAQRDNSGVNVDLGYHYDPLDYVFGGCDFSNNVTFAAGTAVGWYETNGADFSAPYGISLENGAALSFTGDATQPCIFARYDMVQEGIGNKNLTNNSLGGVVINGNGSVSIPRLSANFTKWTADAPVNIYSGDSAYGAMGFLNCEFYDASLDSYGASVCFSNCLFFRNLTDFYDQYTNTAFVFQDCTFYNGGLAMARTNSFPVSNWQVENSSFDGTCFTWVDSWNGSNNYTLFNYNAYNTNNFNWTTYAYLSPPTNAFLETNGTQDVIVTNYNWESSWFGNFYLPTNSPLIRMGSTNANYLGLYHFTTQTNQTVEGTNKIDIGYHYVATDTNGNPISTPGDGIPDYLADTNGNGIDDPGETPWDIGILSQPEGTNVAQGQNATFAVTVGGIGPFTYQWLLDSNAITGATSSNYTALVVQQPQDGSLYSVIANNGDGYVTSSIAILGVEVPLSITNYPQSQTNVLGTNVSFYVGVSGNYVSYQWSTNGVPIENGSRITGGTNNTLTISNIVVSDANTYTVSVTNLFGPLQASATLMVVTNPVITSISPNTNAIQSEDVTFTVTASGETETQWYFSNVLGKVIIPNATQTNYTQLVVQPTNDGLYSVVITNVAGSTNDGATLNVLVPSWITQQPTNLTVNQGSNATFRITAIGTTNLGYQWFMNGTNAISWATSSSMTLTNVVGTNAGGYSCLVTNIAGTNMSAWAWLSVELTNGITTNGWGGTNGGNPPISGTFVSMISPTNASPTNPFIFPYANLPISIRATASSVYGYVTNVAFYFTGTNSGPASFKLAGNAVPGPNIVSNTVFALAWTNALPGTNILEAVAQDYDGQTSTSSLVYVIMTAPPTVSVGPSITNLVWVEGSSSIIDSVFGVITNDGQPYSYVTNISWSASGPGTATFSPANSLTPSVTFSTNGFYQVTLWVNNGYATNSTSCTVNIERHPKINFISPTNDEVYLTNTPVVLSATATPYDGNITSVAFNTNSVFFANGIQSINSTWTCLWNNAPLWTNIVSAVAYCSDGLTSTDTVTNIVVPPLSVWFLAPTNNQLFVYSPTNILLTALPFSYFGATNINVVFTNQTKSIGLGTGTLETNSTYQLLWEDVTNGTNTITVTANDNLGNTATNAVTIIVNAMPTVSIINPADLQSFSEAASVTLVATNSDSDGTVTNVQFYAYSIATNNLLTNLPAANGGFHLYDFTWTNLSAGSYPVVAVATDNRGASTVSGIVVFQVKSTNESPSVEIACPTTNAILADGSDFTIVATVTNGSAPVTNVEFYANGQDIGGNPTAPYELTECCWEPGTYQLIAIATDELGDSSISSNVQITIAQDPPSGQGFWDNTFFPLNPPNNGEFLQLYQYAGYFYLLNGFPTDPCGNSLCEVDCEEAVVSGSDYYCASFDLNYSDGPNQSDFGYDSSLYRWDGTNWFRWGSLDDAIPCTNALPLNTITAVAVDGTNVYVGGEIGEFYNESWTGYNVILLNGTNCTQLGDSFTNVFTYIGSDDALYDLNTFQYSRYYKEPQLKIVDGSLYLYGNLGDQSNSCIQFIAKWDPTLTNWVPVGPPLNGPVYDIASLQGHLVIGGTFTNAGGNPYANDIAELQNGNWTNFASGIGGYDTCFTYDETNQSPSVVFSIAVCGTNLFVGGDFTTAGSQTNVNSVAVWNGVSWQGISGGLYSSIMHSYSYGESGIFAYANFLNPVVYSIATHGNSTLYIGGVFTGAINTEGSVVPVGNVVEANWNGDEQQWLWSPMDLGIYRSDDLGGNFREVYGPSVDTVTVLNGPSPGPYDVVVGSLDYFWSESDLDAENFDNFVGQSALPFISMARWRVGYPAPPSVPSVTITNPLNDAIFTNLISVGTNISITATATSSYTNIANVYFSIDGNYNDGSQVGSSTSYTYIWNIEPGTEFGPHTITATAVDGEGLSSNSSPIVIDIKNPTNTIMAVDDQFSVPANSLAISLPVLTNDRPGTGLKISGIAHPNNTLGTVTISYDQTHLIYSTIPNQYGSDIFFYTITNAAGAVDSASVTVNILPQPQLAITSPEDGSYVPAPASPLVISGTASAIGSGNTVTNVQLSIISANSNQSTNLIPVNGTFTNYWTDSILGFYTFVATGTDANGMTNVSSPVTISIYNSSIPPSTVTASISDLNPTISSMDGFMPQSDPVLTNGIFDLQGEARDSVLTNPVSFQVLLYQSDPGVASVTSDPNQQAAIYLGNPPFANVTPGPLNAQGFHDGGDNNGDLGMLNFAAVPNGVYELILVVRGGTDETNTLAEFQLSTPLKIGKFTFSEQDLSLPVNGIPITITRTYSSQNQNSADFGYGWTFVLNSLNVQLDEQRTDVSPLYGGSFGNGPSQTVSIRNGGGWDVSLTLPNGQQTTFDFDPQQGFETYIGQWNAPAWARATLAPLDQYDLPNDPNAAVIECLAAPICWAENPGTFDSGAPFENQDFPGWVLTTLPDNTQYYITRGSVTNVICEDPNNPGATISATVYGSPALSKIVEPSGNKIFINSGSIYHVDPSNNISAEVTITRDYQGRITAIYDPNSGTSGLPLVQYVYNQDTGNLIQVIKLLDRNTGICATNHYDYNNPNFPHYITSIENADGVPVTRNYYDSPGLLIATEDANGNTTQYIHNLTNNTEIVIDPLGRTNSYLYDGSGNILAQTNALNQVTMMAYDSFNDKTNLITFHNGQAYTNSYSYDPQGLGLLLFSSDPLGDTNAFAYNGFGEPLTSTDARGNTMYNSYDSSGELTNAVDALDDTNQNTYNDGLLASSTDPVGTTTTNIYDDNGNLIASASVNSGTILSSNTYNYDADNNRITSAVWRHVGTSWVAATTSYSYDAQNRVFQTIDPDGGTNTVVYNLLGQQAETIDANGNTNTYIYDALGHLIQTMYPDGTSETSAYDAVGNRTNSVDRLGWTNTYVYDAINRVIETGYPDGATNATIYDDMGRVAQTIDARSTITANAYDAAGRRIVVTNAFGTIIANTNFYAYDPNGNQITFTDANGHTTTNVYDVLNRQVQVEYPDGTTTETVYDRDSRSVAQINQDDITNWFGYDGSGRLISVTNGLNQVTRYQYDEAGNEIAQIDALGRTNTYAYDDQGRRILHTMPGGQSEGFAYDLDGNQIYETNFNGAVITNQYDENNRLINVSSLDGYNVSFAYSATGQRTNMVDPSGAYTYIYDLRDRLLQKMVDWNNGPSNSLNYAYDSNGNVTNISSGTPNGVDLIYFYDPLNRLTNVMANGSASAAYAYDFAGNLQAMRYGNEVTNLSQYDSLNRLTNAVWKLTLTPLANFSYLLGSTGTRTNLNEYVGGTNRLYTWQYDRLYRLTNENESGSSSPSGNLFYQYDPVGNRSNRNSTSGLTFLTNQVFSFNTNDWLSTDKYDSEGNTTNSANTFYQYDVMNHLTNAGGILMTYDGDGNRVSKKVGSTTTYYLIDEINPSGYAQVLEEWTVNTSTNLSKIYNYGLNLISQRQPNTSTNYFIFDGHGSTRMLVDIGGNTVNVMAYDAYGDLIASNGVLQTGYLYSGQQYDFDLRLYYNRARLLNPNTGRFWTADTTDGNNEDPLSLHKYLYAADDPVNLDDPSGNDYGDFDININSIFNLLVTIAANLSSEGGVVSGFGSGSGSDDTSELSAGRPSPPPHVTVISTVPADHMTFTALDGEQFYAPPGTDFRNVYKQGASINDGVSDITAALHYNTIKNHCAQWGSLDYQRNNGHGVNPPGQDNFFYKAYTHASNYAVGVYMEAAGFTLDEIIKYAGGYAAKHSSNAKSADLKKWWGNGYNAGKNGTPNGVSSPVP